MKRLISSLLVLMMLLGMFSAFGTEAQPVVEFDRKIIVSFQGREVSFSVTLKNPARYKEEMTAQVVDEEGTVVGETTLWSSKPKRRISLTIPETWLGAKYLSVMVNGQKVSKEDLLLAVDDIRNKAIRRVNTSYNKMSITFDAANGDKNMVKVLDTLDKYGVKATFFVTGHWADLSREWLQEVVRRGHELGNHTWVHPRLNGIPYERVVSQVERTNAIIEELTGQRPVAFRPPYGEMNEFVRCLVRSQGFETYMWTYDSHDWDKNYNIPRILKRITKDIQAGDIILFHQGGFYTPEVIEEVIPYYQSLGLELVTIAELMDEGPYIVDKDGVVQFLKETGQ